MLDDIVASALDRMNREGRDTFSVTVTVQINRPTPSPRPPAVQMETITADAPDGLTHSQRAVLNAVKDGNHRPSQVEQVTGLRHRQTAYLLKELVTAGHLVKTRYGRYQAAA